MVSIPFAFGAPFSTTPASSADGRAVERDDATLRAIYAEHGPPVRRFLLGLLRGHAAADDALQETFVRAFRGLGDRRDGERLAPWLFGIARNVAREQRRRTRREAPIEGSGEAVDDRSPERTAIGRQALRAAEAALARLGDDRRAALLLRVDHGLGYDEIATLLGWSLAKTKVEIHRARLVLRAGLTEGDER